MSPWWTPDRHADRAPLLRARAKALAAIRAWFDRQGFLEADVGTLVASPGAETHLHAFRAGAGFLHTSPEFAMKKLLAAGERNIFYLGKVYRAGEKGPLHAPEFTMLEWYRAEAPYTAIQADSVAIVREVCAALGASGLRWRAHACDPFTPPEQRRVKDFISEPLSADEFSERIVVIERELGHPSLTILSEYPIAEAALARPAPHDPSVAERFELYACGVELANGFGELTDAAEQRKRLAHAMQRKRVVYGDAWPIDEDFLQALEHMPEASGCALGVDRLVLLAAGGAHIDQVLWTPPQ
ncbi:MAG: EF-P lysine aminoacylase GenX [Alphaproteobacteria bacterium]|nr:EF-P lysine aminoacylase GenX [Alphaproteobacteria bacterium]